MSFLMIVLSAESAQNTYMMKKPRQESVREIA